MPLTSERGQQHERNGAKTRMHRTALGMHEKNLGRSRFSSCEAAAMTSRALGRLVNAMTEHSSKGRM